jgi:Uncharacterized protein, homolog of phage Mu protein gp30
MINKKNIVVSRISESSSIMAAYQNKLKALVKDMRNSIEWYMKGRIKRVVEAVNDSNPATEVQKELDRIKRQYAKKTKELSKDLAKKIVLQIRKDAQNRLIAKVKDVKPEIKGIKLTMSEPMKIKVSAAIKQNVSLIRTIPDRYFSRIENTIMSNVRNNEGTASLFKQLVVAYGITQSQATLIAVDQTRKIHAEIIRQECKELGFNTAIWRHSGISREPRISHQRADGKKFDINKGCKIDGEYIYAAQKPGCNCYEEIVIE